MTLRFFKRVKISIFAFLVLLFASGCSFAESQKPSQTLGALSNSDVCSRLTNLEAAMAESSWNARGAMSEVEGWAKVDLAWAALGRPVSEELTTISVQRPDLARDLETIQLAWEGPPAQYSDSQIAFDTINGGICEGKLSTGSVSLDPVSSYDLLLDLQIPQEFLYIERDSFDGSSDSSWSFTGKEFDLEFDVSFLPETRDLMSGILLASEADSRLLSIEFAGEDGEYISLSEVILSDYKYGKTVRYFDLPHDKILPLIKLISGDEATRVRVDGTLVDEISEDETYIVRILKVGLLLELGIL